MKTLSNQTCDTHTCLCLERHWTKEQCHEAIMRIYKATTEDVDWVWDRAQAILNSYGRSR